jgi:hypothetical protein
VLAWLRVALRDRRAETKTRLTLVRRLNEPERDA